MSQGGEQQALTREKGLPQGLPHSSTAKYKAMTPAGCHILLNINESFYQENSVLNIIYEENAPNRVVGQIPGVAFLGVSMDAANASLLFPALAFI